MDIQEIALDKILPPRLQPRLTLDPSSITELAHSIKTHGLISPLTVVADGESYRLLAGNRRFHALQSIGVTTADCNVIIADPKLQDEITIAENLIRLNLSPLEEAYAFALYLNQTEDTHDQLAARLGQERTYVTRRLLLLDLDDHTLGALQEGVIGLSQALLLRRIEDPAVRERFIEHTEAYGANVRTMTYWITNYEREQARAQAANEAPNSTAAFEAPRQTFMACDRCADPTAYDLLRPAYLCPACKSAVASHQALQALQKAEEQSQ